MFGFRAFDERDDEWPEFGRMVDVELVEILDRAVMVKLPKVKRPIKVPIRSLTIQQVSNTSVLNLQVLNNIRLLIIYNVFRPDRRFDSNSWEWTRHLAIRV